MASTGSALFLHGGAAIDGTMHGDTRQWAGGEWKQLQEIGPAPRIQHAMAFDTNQISWCCSAARMCIAVSLGGLAVSVVQVLQGGGGGVTEAASDSVLFVHAA